MKVVEVCKTCGRLPSLLNSSTCRACWQAWWDGVCTESREHAAKRGAR